MQKKPTNKSPLPKLSEDDSKLFLNAVRDIKPLRHDKIVLKKTHADSHAEEIIPEKHNEIKSTQTARMARSKKNQPEILSDEISLFQNAVKDITPLKHDKTIHKSKPSNKYPQQNADEQHFVTDTLSDEAEVEEVQATGNLSYCELGIQKRVFKKLRRGQYIIIDELDLHGLNIKQAKSLLVHFLEVALQVEGSCVSIIHGKGHRSGDREPVLKRQTNHWLQQHPRVLAFHSAQAKDGGTGAVYVLLRRTKLAE